MSDITIRIDSYLAGRGLCSRRAVGEYLDNHNVTVNTKRIKKPGERINVKDTILIDGIPLTSEELVYYMLNKPKRVISTASDEHDRQNVVSLIPTNTRIYPVGRLDKNTTGLILLTNDGDFTNKVTHPKNHIKKVYRLTIYGNLTNEQEDMLTQGIELSDGKTQPATVSNFKKKGKTLEFDLGLFEGRNRQIRRMCEKTGIKLQSLKRTRIGSLELGELKEGQYRELTKQEVHLLKEEIEKS